MCNSASWQVGQDWDHRPCQGWKHSFDTMGCSQHRFPLHLEYMERIEELLLFPDSMPFFKLPLLNVHFFREGVICINFVPPWRKFEFWTKLGNNCNQIYLFKVISIFLQKIIILVWNSCLCQKWRCKNILSSPEVHDCTFPKWKWISFLEIHLTWIFISLYNFYCGTFQAYQKPHRELLLYNKHLLLSPRDKAFQVSLKPPPHHVSPS